MHGFVDRVQKEVCLLFGGRNKIHIFFWIVLGRELTRFILLWVFNKHGAVYYTD